jgi:ribosomal-protein-alanine N-acetyltransferase
MAMIPALTGPLGDGHVRLRLAAERDIPEILIAYQDDPQLHLRLGLQRPPSGAELGRRAEQAEEAREDGSSATLTVLEPGSDDCRGQLQAENFDWENRRAELRIWLVPEVRGRGLGRRALRLAATWLFEACGLQRVALLIDPGNQPMLRAGAAAGFLTEAVLRGYDGKEPGRADITVMAALPGDMKVMAAHPEDMAG